MVCRNSSKRFSSSALLMRAAHCMLAAAALQIDIVFFVSCEYDSGLLPWPQHRHCQLRSTMRRRLHCRQKWARHQYLHRDGKLRSSHMNLKSPTATRRASAVSIACSRLQLSSSTPNSSPPSLASVSRQRILDFSNAPSCPSSASPAPDARRNR